MFGGDDAVDPSAYRPCRLDDEPAWRARTYEVIENPVGDILVEDAVVAIRLHVELQASEFNAFLAGDVAKANRCEIRLSGHGAQAGELVDHVFDHVRTTRVWVAEGFEF